MPDLPADFEGLVRNYNADVFDLFQQSAWAVASTRKLGADDFKLPYSNASFRESWDERGEPFQKESDFQKGYIDRLLRFRARSPFAAVAGVGDFFTTPNDLVNSIRSVIHLDLNSLPMIMPPLAGDPNRRSLESINSWALDFMIHGKQKMLLLDNGIEPTQAWQLVTNFAQSVEMLIAVVKAYSPKEDIVLKTLQELVSEMEGLKKGMGKGGGD